MIALYAPSNPDTVKLIQVLEGRQVEASTDLVTFQRTVRKAACAIAACRRPRVDGPAVLFSVLADLSRRHPHVPIVLVTRRNSETLRRTAPCRLAAIVWWANAGAELAAIVRRACSTSYFQRAAAEVERTDGIAPGLKRALAFALRATQQTPVRGPSELARAVGYSRITLSQELSWVAPGLELRELTSRLHVLRAAELRATGLTWEAIGRELGFHRNSVARKAKRWPQCSLAVLSTLPLDELIGRFDTEVIRRLIQHGSDKTV